MSKDEKALLVAREWALKGENDLKNAAHTLEMGKECPTDTVCFHAQQCVEKYLKALLVLKDINFPKTHNIEDIIALVPKDLRPKLDDKEQVFQDKILCLKRGCAGFCDYFAEKI
jgi:HEPN domain-containing protein